jgi:hypothetical protein
MMIRTLAVSFFACTLIFLSSGCNSGVSEPENPVIKEKAPPPLQKMTPGGVPGGPPAKDSPPKKGAGSV